ncbi:hypothetical protein EG329_008900 [Mollisiaceae sp. DMI_Dod_QoI]|nr:hypothetical protein EG329_008900 [Helotiales sp. DMI_Dod_QoI]
MAEIPPSIQVSHLPSAASFYSSLTQPLGLQFLIAAPHSPATLHYGFVSNSSSGLRQQTVFTVSQSPVPRLSHITLSAPSSKAVLEFHTKSQILNPDQGRGENTLVKREEDETAITRDFDGNMIEAVYVPRSRGGSSGGSHRGVTLETASTEKEAKRVLEWQENVARSISEEPEELDEPRRARVGYSQSAPRPGTFHRSETFPRARPRRDTITNDTYRRDHEERDRSPIDLLIRHVVVPQKHTIHIRPFEWKTAKRSSSASQLEAMSLNEKERKGAHRDICSIKWSLPPRRQ